MSQDPTELKQGSAKWFDARLGKVTASRLIDVLAVSKRSGEPLQAREEYLAELVAERLSGEPYEHYMSQAMQWGVDHEADAISEYEMREQIVERVGFVPHPIVENAGASPDGLVGDDGLVEIKCPNTSTHIKTLLSEIVPDKYMAQMQWQMACTGRQWCDFCSYDPRLPEEFSVFITRVQRDEEYISEAEDKVRAFLAEVDATIMSLRGKAAS